LASTADAIKLSVIVPAYNSAATIDRCLAALMAEDDPDYEIIIVDDGSDDGTAALAERDGVRVLRLTENSGAAAARNDGAVHAAGDVLVFVDSDVVVAPGTLRRVRARLGAAPGCAAVIGTYDDEPDDPATVSQYINLRHHFVHQRGPAQVSHYWGGLGAIRRPVFESLGGFDEAEIEIADVELGYRLVQAGHRIRLDRDLQGKHLKRWPLGFAIATEFWLRAVPWTRLLLRYRILPDDLSLSWGDRSSALLALVAVLLGAGAVAPGLSAWPAVAAVAAFVLVNGDLFRFFARRRGLAFAASCVPLHILHFLVAGAGLAFALVSGPRPAAGLVVAGKADAD